MTDPIRRAAQDIWSNGDGLRTAEIEAIIRQHIGPLPQWHDKPTYAGLWIPTRNDGGYWNVFAVESEKDPLIDTLHGSLWYGPIPEPPKEGAVT